MAELKIPAATGAFEANAKKTVKDAIENTSSGDGSVTADIHYYTLKLDNTGTAKNTIKATYTKANGFLDMELYAAKSGTTDTIPDNAPGTGRTTIANNTETISLEGLAAGDYILKVSGLSNAEGNYSLTYDTKNYGPADDKNDNDTADKAVNLTETKEKGSVSKLSIHSATDVDWYKIDLDNVGTAKNLIKGNFSKATGRLDMKLYESKASGDSLVVDESKEITDASTLTEKSEQISLEGLAAGTYWLKVEGTGTGATKAQGAYTLAYDGKNYGPADDKNDNDTADKAVNLTETKVKGSVSKLSIDSPTDVDWYKIDLNNIGMAKNLIKGNFSKATGQLDMKLYESKASGDSLVVDESKEITDASTLTEKSEQISLEGLDAGTYWLKVEGVNKAQGAYTLSYDAKDYGPADDVNDPQGMDNNGVAAKAVDLTSAKAKGSQSNLTISYVEEPSGDGYTGSTKGGDQDWYVLDLADFGTAKNFVKATYSNTTGRLDMELYRANESGAIDTTWTGYDFDNNKSVSGDEVVAVSGLINTTASTMTEKSEQISLEGLEPGKYLLKVSGLTEDASGNNSMSDQGKYNLTWDVTDSGPKEDSYEGGSGNDTAAVVTAALTGKSSAKVSIDSMIDVDWYKIDLADVGADKNVVKVVFNEKTVDLDVDLFKLASGSGADTLSNDAAKSGDAGTVKEVTGGVEISLKDLDDSKGDAYYIRIMGVDKAQGAYSMQWDLNDYYEAPAADSTGA